MRLNRFLRTTVAAEALLLAATFIPLAADAADSTSAPHPTMGWQDPTARGINISGCPAGSVVTWSGSAFTCTNTVANAANATTANYANNSGQLGGNGLPTCPTGYALSGNGTNWQCVSNVATSNYSGNSGYSTSSGDGVASVSGTTLTTSDGTQYTLPSGGGSGSGSASCTLPVSTMYGVLSPWYNPVNGDVKVTSGASETQSEYDSHGNLIWTLIGTCNNGAWEFNTTQSAWDGVTTWQCSGTCQ